MATSGEHTSRQFDIELDDARNSILRMGHLARGQFRLALEALNSGDRLLTEQVIEQGYRVNALEVEIDRKCNLILAHRQPEAGDLRLVLTILKITTDLERAGDQAELIAHRVEMLLQSGGVLNLPRSGDINHCAHLAMGMLDDSLDAFARSDPVTASRVIRQDLEVNAEYAKLTRKLIGHMLEHPRDITVALDFLFMVKAIERIGDHAKNISNYVIFMASGRDVRHASLEEMERHAQPKEIQPPQ
jgi:phosphate transport system protein